MQVCGDPDSRRLGKCHACDWEGPWIDGRLPVCDVILYESFRYIVCPVCAGPDGENVIVTFEAVERDYIVSCVIEGKLTC